MNNDWESYENCNFTISTSKNSIIQSTIMSCSKFELIQFLIISVSYHICSINLTYCTLYILWIQINTDDILFKFEVI